jgi:hypothetical protein
MRKMKRLKKEYSNSYEGINSQNYKKRIFKILKTQKIYYLLLINLLEILIFLSVEPIYSLLSIFATLMALIWLFCMAKGINKGIIILGQGKFSLTETPIRFYFNFIIVSIAYIFCTIFPLIHFFEHMQIK